MTKNVVQLFKKCMFRAKIWRRKKLAASRSSLHKKEKTDAAAFFVIVYKNGYFE